MIRRVIFLSVVALTTALGRDVGAQSQQAAQERNITVRLKAYPEPIKLDTLMRWHDVLATPSATYAALREAVDTLKIPLLTADSLRRLLHNPGFDARSRLAGKFMHSWWHCGQGFAGEYADTYRMTIAYAIVVDPTPDGNSRVGIAFVSGAQSLDGASAEPLACGTTGALEQQLLKLTHLEILRR
jgi:hypothetical protein